MHTDDSEIDKGGELRRSSGERACSLQPDVFVSDVGVIARGVFLPGELE